jgi:hypothetical protein
VLVILKQISKGIKETVKIRGNVEENAFIQYYEELWNTTYRNELKLEWNSDKQIDTVIISDELEKTLKLTKYSYFKLQEMIIVIQSYTIMH